MFEIAVAVPIVLILLLALELLFRWFDRLAQPPTSVSPNSAATTSSSMPRVTTGSIPRIFTKMTLLERSLWCGMWEGRGQPRERTPGNPGFLRLCGRRG